MQTTTHNPVLTVTVSYNTPRIIVKDTTGEHWLYLHQILYIKADEKYSRFIVLDSSAKGGMTTYCDSRGISHFKNLCNKYFIRCHRSFMINLLYFKGITPEKTVELHYPVADHIPFSRKYGTAARLALQKILLPLHKTAAA